MYHLIIGDGDATESLFESSDYRAVLDWWERHNHLYPPGTVFAIHYIEPKT